MPHEHKTPEHARLADSPSARSPWRWWGPYLSARQWGTVREDYSSDGNAWNYLPFDHSHLRAYRWGEDGIAGICDKLGFLNFAVAMWNEKDDRLKERWFGLTNGEGNHGEDVKEYWWAVDSTPTHSWMQMLYRYPQAAFPYQQLREENARRGRYDREYELEHTGVLDRNRFFDVMVSYAKGAPDDICITIDVTNHGPEAAPLHLLPHVWFRNTWEWGRDTRRPNIRHLNSGEVPTPGLQALECDHVHLTRYVIAAEAVGGQLPEVLVTENESNAEVLWGAANPRPFAKDGINRRVVHGDEDAVNDFGMGTKAAFWYRWAAVQPGETVSVRLRMSRTDPDEHTFGPGFDEVMSSRKAEADEFYGEVIPARLNDEDTKIARRAFAGLMWGKQLYRYSVEEWIEGDPAEPMPPKERADRNARNATWKHLSLADVISMPDDWEYPWFAAWDLAFHCVALAHVDPAFAKEQLLLLCREWAMHPNGQLPAYEWSFSDVNPPVHAWAAWQVFAIDGMRDRDFLIRIFTKLLLNFGWWVNRKDPDGSDVFSGGFLGMDNIGLFDRSAGMADGYTLEQSDATSWMAFYCLQMLKIAVTLAIKVKAWDETATKFLEHFLAIARAMRKMGSGEDGLWDEDEGFYYDVLIRPDGSKQRLKVRSMVGLLPIMAVANAPAWTAQHLPDFTARLKWLQTRRPELVEGMLDRSGADGNHAMLSLVRPDRLERILRRMFDEAEFFSDYGIRALSASYREPYVTEIDGQRMEIDYEPGESLSGMFGGNSNWRGPIWFPVNVLLTDALRIFDDFFEDTTTFEVPTGSGAKMTAGQAADLIDERLIDLFRVGPHGRRPADGERIEASPDPLWRDHITFSEYFNGDTGEGIGATHQTGWTALVAHLLCRRRIIPRAQD